LLLIDSPSYRRRFDKIKERKTRVVGHLCVELPQYQGQLTLSQTAT
jgi:hypothetical protein